MTSTKRNIIANFVGRGWSGVITLIFMPVYISLMGIEAYGLVGIYLSLFAVLFLLDLGLSTTLNRELAKLSARNENVQQMRNLVRTLELIYWVTAVLIGVCIVLLAPLITHYWIKA
ncbi:MAG TPA: polysaccharide biosynthesis protein, partial [Gammaproteobacteria bacterium]|nr:polysaccharide biosynthesis protein [Gammaproteobacteria bacterium]